MNNINNNKQPRLPGLLAAPFKIIPNVVHNRILCAALNKIFDTQIKEGELDFLSEHTVAIVINDTGISFKLGFTGEKFIASKQAVCDLSVSASLYDYMILISCKQDPDSLVFQRRLVMEGDTELGLGLKNFLDAIDVKSSKILHLAEALSVKTLPLYQRLFS